MKDLPQREVAASAGMDISYLSRLETDSLESKPTRETIDKLAGALKCTRDEHGELIAAAERLDDELIEISRIAKERPMVGKLFQAAVNLSPDKLEEIVAKFEAEIAEANKKRNKKRA